MSEFRQKFADHAKALPPLREDEIEKYAAYFALLREWNEKINLVSRKSIDTSFAYHFADSLWIASFAFAGLGVRQYADLGTGAGFPGLVFAIRYPQIQTTLFEKLAKRRLFLADVAEKLSLKNVRLEGALADKRYPLLFTARAVFPPAELFPFMKKHLFVGGRFVLSLGGSAEALETPKGFQKVAEHAYELPESAGTRKLAMFELASAASHS